MIELKDIQSTIVSQIGAGTVASPTYFDGETIVADVGLSKDTIETALTTRGFCVIADLPIKGKVMMDTANVAETYVTCPVIVQLNPEINASATGAGKVLLEAVQNVVDAVLSYGTIGSDRFELEDDCFHVSVDDGGLVTYIIMFRKLTSLGATVEV